MVQTKPFAQPMTVRQEGDHLVIEVPLAVKVQTSLTLGDRLYAIPSSLGLELTRLTPDEVEAVMVGREFMQRHANAMRALAASLLDDDKGDKPQN